MRTQTKSLSDMQPWADPDATPDLHIDHGARHPHLVVIRDDSRRITRVLSRWETQEQAQWALGVSA